MNKNGFVESIAHIRQSDGEIQTVEQHLHEVRALAEKIGEKLGIRHVTGLAGLLHDIGKYTEQFVAYILQAVQNPDNPPRRGEVDHSTAGGKLLFLMYHEPALKSNSRYKLLAEIVGNAIISHHAYLHDYISPELESGYLRRVRDKWPEGFELTKEMFFERVMAIQEFQQYADQAAAELERFIIKGGKLQVAANMMLLEKMVFSALIDADRSNTRGFEEKLSLEQQLKQGERGIDSFQLYYNRLLQHIEKLELKPGDSEVIYHQRRQMSEQCDRFALRESGIYTLSIPTGGGKTLASLRYALKHAMKYGKEHIVYVVPYTTIIEQNAAEVRDILIDDTAVLEHHCNVILDDHPSDEAEDGVLGKSQKLKLALENWNTPIIFTTMVQFLNVLYSKGTKNIRRLHQIANSVIIFDEVQKVPIHCITLFNRAVNFLQQSCDSSIVLCTATQPALDYVKHGLNVQEKSEMVENLKETVAVFKRVEIIPYIDYELTTEELADMVRDQLTQVDNVLVILNTKAVVKKLYNSLIENLNNEVCVVHLSTSMCPEHRRNMLETIHKILQAGQKVVCVSTQLIEAGVNISFQSVIRSLAGLDSIAQAAGRCNRHGEHLLRYMYLIRHKEERLDKLKEIKVGAYITELMIRDMQKDKNLHESNLLSESAMRYYFKQFYTDMKEMLDYRIASLDHTMVEILMTSKKTSPYFNAYIAQHGNQNMPLLLSTSHWTAAQKFEVIPDLTTSILVPYGEGEKLIARLNGSETIDDLSKLLKKAQQFSINVYDSELRQLSQNGDTVPLLDGNLLALKEGIYSKQYGLDLNGEGEIGFLSY